jgi:beta-phosphoglucomutase family hydrolase
VEKEAEKAVIWDMDGVIADTGPQHYWAWRSVLAAYKIDLTEADFRRTFGQNNESIIRGFLGDDMSPEKLAEIAGDKEIEFRRIARRQTQASPGVSALLSGLRAVGYKMALASSAPRENISLILGLLGLAEYFDAMVADDDVSRGKPDPEVFLKAAARLGVNPAQSLVIEDAVSGVMAARRAGMRCLAVTVTHPAAALKDADLTVDSLAEVDAAIIGQLLNS